MKPIQVHTIEDLRSRMNFIAGLLQCTDLHVYAYAQWPKSYMLTDNRDRVVSTHGLAEGIPFIREKANHSKTTSFRMLGCGTVLYETKAEPKLRYVLYNTFTEDSGDEYQYLVCRKQDAFKLLRMAHRLHKLSHDTAHPPVLEDGVLDDFVQNTVGFISKAREIEKFGVRIKRGIILDGPPGNGKTMLCRYIQRLCAQRDISYGTVTSAEMDAAYERKELGDLFSEFDITFFDDIDVAYMDRTRGRANMACSLLTAMDGMQDSQHAVRIFTTNELVGDLDEAFTRPGRIDKCITLNKPDQTLRRRLVATVWPKEITDHINVDHVIERSEGFSFAELESVRTFLVTNHVLGNGQWDLEKALGELAKRRSEKKANKAGF